MKTLRFLGMMLIAAAVAFASCSKSDSDKDSNSGGNNNGGGNSNQPTQSEDIGSFINTNPSDPLQLQFKNSKGEEAMLFGTKDSEGAPLKVEYMSVKNSGETENTYLFMNEDDMLSKVIAPNGVIMTLEWLSGTKAAVIMVDPNTGEQLNTVVDFENKDQAAPAINHNAPMRSGEAKMTLVQSKHSNNSTPSMQLGGITRSSAGITGHIYITGCGGPMNVDGGVYVDIYDAFIGQNTMPSKGKHRNFLKCYKFGTGHYQFSLAGDYMANENISKICSKLDYILGKICYANSWTLPGTGAKEYLCVAISAAITTAGAGISAPVAAAFAKACLAATISLDTACALMNGNVPIPDEFGDPDTSPVESISSKLCDLLKEVESQWTGLYIQPLVEHANKSKRYDGQWLTEGQQFSDVTVDFGGVPTINSFTLNPPAPGAYVGYDAIAKLTCLPEDSKVVMTIVGTDGYSKTETTTVPASSTGEFTATMHVPGSYEGVLDEVNITVTTPDGQTLTKKASLVFGK